jgi:hypothetical protein
LGAKLDSHWLPVDDIWTQMDQCPNNLCRSGIALNCAAGNFSHMVR